MSIFHFKQFDVKQDKSSMKVGTDAVLLGTWVRINTLSTSALEVGTGCGVISLIIAQRYPEVTIDAIDIDQESVCEAEENFINSPWKHRLNAINKSLQEYNTTKVYDFIISNPPYFNNSLQCPKQQRTNARHTNTLSYNDLLNHSHNLLSNNGSLSVILPYEEGKLFIRLSTEYNFILNRITKVYPTPTSQPKRMLIELIKQPATTNSITITKVSDIQQHSDTLVIENSRHNYTDDYISLTKDFYLNM